MRRYELMRASECFLARVESVTPFFRYCLRELAKNPQRKLQEVHTEAQQEWKKVLGDTGVQEMFLKIREK